MTVNSFSGFFNRIEYLDKDLKNGSWLSKAEKTAQVLRAPSHWLAAELCNGKEYVITYTRDTADFTRHEQSGKVDGLMRRIARFVAGIFLSIPGQILALPLMAIAYCSEEIRLKRRISVRDLTDEESQKLDKMIEARLELAGEKKGDPVTCSILCSICYMMCCLVCKK